MLSLRVRQGELPNEQRPEATKHASEPIPATSFLPQQPVEEQAQTTNWIKATSAKRTYKKLQKPAIYGNA